MIESTPATPNGGFVPVSGAAREQVGAAASVVAAYLLIWAILMLFAFITWRRLRGLELSAERVKQALAKAKA